MMEENAGIEVIGTDIVSGSSKLFRYRVYSCTNPYQRRERETELNVFTLLL